VSLCACIVVNNSWEKLGKLNMIVPMNFRRKGEIPRVLVPHYTNVPDRESEVVHCVRVTKPMRTILDLLTD
jgi:hypothetical protein